MHKQQYNIKLRYDTQKTWFSRLIRHLARKWRGSILTSRTRTGLSFKKPANPVHLEKWRVFQLFEIL